MRGRTLVIYILILICIAGYYYYFEVYRPVATDMSGEEPSVINLQASDVEDITIAGSETITLSQKGSSWWITAPVEMPADPSEIEDLLATALRMKSQRTLEDTPSFADLGLDPPRLLLNFRTKDAESFVHIGNPTPTKQYCYARSSAIPGVFLINAYEESGLNRDVFALRDKHIFSLSYGDITKVSIKRHGLIMEYLKDKDGLWHLLQDPAAKLKTEKINELVGRLCRSQAKAFPDQLSVSGDPDIVIELFSKDGSGILNIWQMPHIGDNIYAYSNVLGQLVEIHGSIVSPIPHAPFEVMDRSLVVLDTGKVDKIVLSGKEDRVFTRKGGHWFSGDKRLEESSSVDSFLTAVGALEYVDEYMMLPEDVQLKRSVQISYQDLSSVFDIGLYSQYYVALGDTFYQIDEGGMKMINDSFDMLMKCSHE